MAGNGKVFISHSHDDNERCAPLLTVLDALGVDYFFDVQGLSAGQRLDERLQAEMASRDVFLRVCTAALTRSFWTSLEVSAFRGLQSEDRRQGRGDKRVLINIIFDKDYQPEPFDSTTLFIDAVNQPPQVWIAQLKSALNVAVGPGRTKVSRRAVIGLGAAAAVTISSAGAAAAFLVDAKSHNDQPKYISGKVAWEMDGLSDKKDRPPVSTVDGDTLYVATGTKLFAYDLANGRKQLWLKTFNPQFGYAWPLAADGTVYYGVDTTLYALDGKTGNKRWSVRTDQKDYGNFNGYVVAGGYVYALSELGYLYAFSAGDGNMRWENPVLVAAHLLARESGPVVDHNTLYIGSLDHNVYALNSADGTVKWKFLTRGKVLSTPAIDGGIVYVGSCDGYVYALHADNGSVKWKYRTESDVRSSPAVSDGVVFVGSDDKYLYALDAETGQPFWRSNTGKLDTSEYGNGLITDGNPIICTPVLTRDAVCIIDGALVGQTVYCFNRADGATRWTYASKGQYQNADPIAANGLILFGSGDQNLYAFGA